MSTKKNLSGWSNVPYKFKLMTYKFVIYTLDDFESYSAGK